MLAERMCTAGCVVTLVHLLVLMQDAICAKSRYSVPACSILSALQLSSSLAVQSGHACMRDSAPFTCTSSCRDSTPTATAVTHRDPAGMESFRKELEWLDVFSSAVSCKPVNDLALWLYIYREEGWGCGAGMMGLIAVLSNLPVSPCNISFAFTVANCYTGGFCCADVLVASRQHRMAA